jgi:3-mercaptopyruvate sulfurtransferase SseA
MFADPKQSRIDIVQAAGRALRQYRGKNYGYIVVPLIVPAKMDFKEFAETTAFRQVAQTITALSTQDERIADEFRAIEKGRISSGKIVEIEGDVPVGMKMKLGDFAEAISARVWENVGGANWRRFEAARTLVRSLNLKSETEWRAYCRSGRKPNDIPYAPQLAYAGTGWAGWGDWLGTDNVATYLREYRPFRESRAIVYRLGLKSFGEWLEYNKSGKRPADIPSSPRTVYAQAGWAGWGDWLGTDSVSNRLRHFRSFEKARAFARGLRLKSHNEWRAYCQSGKKPSDIPTAPNRTYAEAGWAGVGDWLGTDIVATHLRQYRSFNEARAFARDLGLKSQGDWRAYCESGKKPAYIPAQPQKVYAGAGWAGTGDWLGTGIVATRLRQYWSFKKARAFARALGLKSAADWRGYCKSGKKPTDIPSGPSTVYAQMGWAGWSDWLGI